MSDEVEFFIDRAGAARSEAEAAWNRPVEQVHENAQANGARTTENSKKRPRSKKPAWVDEDDNAGRVNLVEHRRTRKFRKKHGEKRIGTGEYEERVRNFYEQKVSGKKVGAGEWARLPSEKGDDIKRNDSESESDASGSDSESDGNEGLSERVERLFRKSGPVGASRKQSTVATAISVAARERGILQPGVLNMKRVTNLNKEAPSKSVTHSVDFHPSGRIALTAGLDRTVRIFQVDGRMNARIQGVVLRDLQLATASFTGRGEAIVASGAQAHVYKMDLASGSLARHNGFAKAGWKSTKSTKKLSDTRNGFVVSGDGTLLAFLSTSGRIPIVHETTMQMMGVLHVPSQIGAAAFDPADEKRLYTVSREGVVHLWDTRMMACVDQHRDEGTLRGTAIAVSGAHYAVGSDAGVVNVYEKSQLGGARTLELEGTRTEKPLKAIENLTTWIDCLRFNHDGRILSMASRVVKDSAKMVHVPSMSVFSNWPNNSSVLRRVQTTAFSPGSGYFAIGNDKGDAYLYRLKAYPAN